MTRHSITDYCKAFTLAISITGLATGCGSEHSPSVNAPNTPSINVESEETLITDLVFPDGSRIEFLEVRGVLSIVGAGESSDNTARSFMNEKPADAVEFYERITGSKAPEALVEANRRAASARPGPIPPPDVEQVAAEEGASARPELTPLHWSDDDFESSFCNFPNGSIICWLNRTNNRTVYITCSGINVNFLARSGAMTLTVKRWDGWSGTWVTRYSRDAVAGDPQRELRWYTEITLLDEPYAVLVTRATATGDVWHLSAGAWSLTGYLGH